MMQPGRELDALVAEHVMGYTGRDVPYPRGGGYTIWTSLEGRVTDKVPLFSTDDDAAWRVVLAMWEKGYSVELGHVPWHPDGNYEIIFDNDKGDRFSSLEDTFAHAVCVAALRALGVEV